MGLFRERAARGEAFNPPPYELAAALADWNPRTDDVDALDLPHPSPTVGIFALGRIIWTGGII